MEQAPRSAQVEVDLLTLLARLWHERYTMLVTFMVIALLAVAYAVFAPAIYQSRATLLTPRPSEVAGFNIGRNGAQLDLFSPKDVYGIFTRNLVSDTLNYQFFREVYLPSLTEEERSAYNEDELRQEFAEVLVVVRPNDADNGKFEVWAQHEDPQVAAKWVNDYVERAGKMAMTDIQHQIREDVAVRTTELDRRIADAREFALTRRDDRIARLREALQVAEAVGIEQPINTLGNMPTQGALSSFVNGDELYMTGAKAIRTELEVLQKRESDDPFISELRDMQERMSFLKRIQLAPEGVAVYTLDAPGMVPMEPIKPDRPLVVVLGVLIGAMLGFMIGLVRALWHTLKRQA